MAIDIIFRVPLRNCRIGKWVKTSYMEGLDKEFVVVFRELGKLVVVLDDGQRIEDDGNEQRYNGRPFFLSLDAENIEYFFMNSYYFLRKNLTSRKFTGMQMQSVGIMAICLANPKPTKRLRKSVCIL